MGSLFESACPETPASREREAVSGLMSASAQNSLSKLARFYNLSGRFRGKAERSRSYRPHFANLNDL